MKESINESRMRARVFTPAPLHRVISGPVLYCFLSGRPKQTRLTTGLIQLYVSTLKVHPYYLFSRGIYTIVWEQPAWLGSGVSKLLELSG